MAREYQIEEIYLNETGELQYQVEGVYLNETVEQPSLDIFKASKFFMMYK